jgi:two-component system response regulator DesR
MALIRAGLVACISREHDIEVAAELDRREPELPAVAALRPDVAVIDDGIAAAGGFAVIRDLHDAVPCCRALIMATRPCPRDLRQAVAAHAAGFVRKDAGPDGISRAIRQGRPGHESPGS